MHNWSDDSFDWKGLNESIYMMDSFMRFWGRIHVNSKEKFGTARLYVYFWDGSLHGLLYPGHVSSQFPKWLWSLDINYISKFIRRTRFHKLVQWWQYKVYGLAYAKALKYFPHIKAEIVCAADAPQLIKGYEDIMTKYQFCKLIEKIILPVEYEDEE